MFRFYRIFKKLRVAVLYPFWVVCGLVFMVQFIWHEIALELDYRHRFGAAWIPEYERDQGSLAHAHLKLAIAVLGLLVVVGVCWWAYRQMGRSRKRRHRRHVA